MTRPFHHSFFSIVFSPVSLRVSGKDGRGKDTVLPPYGRGSRARGRDVPKGYSRCSQESFRVTDPVGFTEGGEVRCRGMGSRKNVLDLH